MRLLFALPLVLCAFGLRAQGAITVISNIVNTGAGGIRAQAEITNKTAVGELGVTAVAIKEIHATILIRDASIPNGLSVTKRQLTAQETYGLGLPNGYTQPPFTDPEGPWFGLIWPYRDQYDYFPGPFDPLGDDVGVPFQSQPGVYGFVDIDGIARGGPTDPVPSPGSSDPSWLLRGLTGNGLPENPATYFAFDLVPLIGPFDRAVEVRIFAATVRVVVQDDITDEYSEMQIPVPDFQTFIVLPEPATLSMAGAGVALLLLRRRSRS